MPTELLTAEDKERIKAETLANCDLIADCWIYKGASNPYGYGMKKIGKKVYTVSRFMLAYDTRESLVNPEYDACHRDDICPYKACCNPRHLYWATKSENCKAREKRAKEERELFASHPLPSDELDRGWDRSAWVNGIFSSDHRDLGIDHCLASLNRGRIVHATTELWEDSFPDEIRKVFSFLADISRQTWERLRGQTGAPLTIL
jgi:hypothetical protein